MSIVVSRHRVLNDCTLSFFKFDLQNLIEDRDGLVCVADLEILTDHPCDLPSLEKAFLFLCSFFLDENPSFLISVDDFLGAACYLRVKNLEVALQHRHGHSNGVFTNSISMIHHCFNRATCRRYFTPEIHSPDPEISAIRPGFELKFFSLLPLRSCVSAMNVNW